MLLDFTWDQHNKWYPTPDPPFKKYNYHFLFKSIRVLYSSSTIYNNFLTWCYLRNILYHKFCRLGHQPLPLILTKILKKDIVKMKGIPWITHILVKLTDFISLLIILKGVFTKNKRGYRLTAKNKRFWSLLILLLSFASIRRKLLKRSDVASIQIQKVAKFKTDRKKINLTPNKSFRYYNQ